MSLPELESAELDTADVELVEFEVLDRVSEEGESGVLCLVLSMDSPHSLKANRLNFGLLLAMANLALGQTVRGLAHQSMAQSSRITRNQA